MRSNITKKYTNNTNSSGYEENKDYKRRLYQKDHISILVPKEDLSFSTSSADALCSSEDSIKLSEELCLTKDKLDAFECDRYRNVKMQVDLYRNVRFIAEDVYGAQHVTNAWLKYWEIYSQYNVAGMFNGSNSPLKIFCNAELPGSSICAWNHYAHTYDIKYDWRASSFSPYAPDTDNETVLGDKFNLWKLNRSKWLMDVEKRDGAYFNDGDATNLDNLLDFESRVGPGSEFGGCHIYSHDAGMDVTSDYNKQELINMKLHLGCAIAGFLTMRKGALFIAKQYSYFEPLSLSLIPIYSSMFDEFYLSKPLASRPSNSEIYLIGKGYRGIDDKIRAKLCDKLKNFNTTALLTTIHKTTSIAEFSEIVFRQQINQINEQVDIFCKNPRGLLFVEQKKELERKWFERYPMKKLSKNDWLDSN